jgi:hypothetical protein
MDLYQMIIIMQHMVAMLYHQIKDFILICGKIETIPLGESHSKQET